MIYGQLPVHMMSAKQRRPRHIDPITSVAPHQIPIPVSTQVLKDVVFAHWSYDPEELRHLVPSGMMLDVLGEQSWVGLVGVRIHDVRITGLVGLPHVGDFDQVNLRLYTIGPEGRRGTMFLAMEIPRLAVAVSARVGLRLPSHWAQVQRHHNGDTVTYRTRRVWPEPAAAGGSLTVRIGEPVEAGDLENFLTARWGLHTPWYGVPLYAPLVHEEWPLNQAHAVEFTDEGLFAAANVPPPVRPPDHLLYAPVVHSRSGAPIPRLCSTRSMVVPPSP